MKTLSLQGGYFEHSSFALVFFLFMVKAGLTGKGIINLKPTSEDGSGNVGGTNKLNQNQFEFKKEF